MPLATLFSLALLSLFQSDTVVRDTIVAAPPGQDMRAISAFVGSRTTGRPMKLLFASHGEGVGALTFLYPVGPDFCGSGGCNLWILRRTETGYEPVGDLTVTRLPLRVLQTSHHGLPDLAVAVAGGGATPHEALIQFDGRHYASNPSTAPVLAPDTPGETLLTAEDYEAMSAPRP
jgi:hypothetical protein